MAGHERPFEVLDSAVRRRILDLLGNLKDTSAGEAGDGGMTAAELSIELDLHVTTCRFHLRVLEKAGLVESYFRRSGVGRPRKVFRLPLRPLPEPAAAGEALRMLTALLTEDGLHSGDGSPMTPEEAGRAWAMRHLARETDQPRQAARSTGEWLGKVGETMDLMRHWGYRPELRTEDEGRTAELLLYECPFIELATQHPDVVCGVHRGLLRGALDAVGEPGAEVGLQPFAAPGLCLARLRTAAELPRDQPAT